ncbi:MAG: Ig-like domain-containing protein [Armatimonadota bacterium]|nr:Ig-like domain-containing protein [Armatimonadota bacterium]MCX7777187.1 Ig-like domain-containing protein [Armatimonadota bacterium]MDW8025014.1 Ig-like domain-containing protein [Armatimonadota bacterium]
MRAMYASFLRAISFTLLMALAAQLQFAMAGEPQPFQPIRFLITASPQEIPANGKSTSIITVQVDDPSIPDGTEVRFISSMPDTTIEPSAILRNRIARATLRSGTTPGIAIVTAFFGVSRESVEVRLLPPQAAMSRDANLIIVKGDYLSYSPGDDFITASGYSRFIHMGVKVECDVRMNIFLSKRILVAEGEAGKNSVTITCGENKLHCDRLVLDYERQEGTMIQTAPQPRKLGIRWLTVIEEEEKMPRLQAPEPDYSIDQTWIRAKEIIIYPGEKIVLKRAQLYARGNRLISLPIHVIPLSTYGLRMSSRGFANQIISYNSYGGLQIDFPLYFHADTKGTGALRLQYFGSHGFGVYRPGFTVSLEESYVLGENSEGVILLEALTRPERNFRLEHLQRLGMQSMMRISADYFGGKDLLTRIDYIGQLGSFDLGIEAFYNRTSFGSSWNTQAMVQLPMRSIGKSGFGYSVVGYLTLGSGRYASGSFSQGIDFDFYSPPYRLGKATSLSFRGGISAFNSDDGLRLGRSAMLSLNHQLSRFGMLSISYSYDSGSLFYGGRTTNESLMLNFYGNIGRNWSIALSASKSFSSDSTYGYLHIVRSLGDRWRLRLGGSYQGYSGMSTVDYDVSVAYRLGDLWISLNWQKSRRKVFLEIGSYVY